MGTGSIRLEPLIELILASVLLWEKRCRLELPENPFSKDLQNEKKTITSKESIQLRRKVGDLGSITG